MRLMSLATGACLAVGTRAAMKQAIVLRFRLALRDLNAGRVGSLLAAYHDRAVLRFHDGDHRWSGTHRGKDAIERFLRELVGAGLQGTLHDVWMGGPPWALTLVARFDDHALAPDGEVIYRNRAVLVVRTRWGRIIEQDDFYEDTARIEAFEDSLRELGVASPEAGIPRRPSMSDESGPRRSADRPTHRGGSSS